MRTKKLAAALVLAATAAAVTPSAASASLVTSIPDGGVAVRVPQARVAGVVRQVTVHVPTVNEVGSNVSGFVQVQDVGKTVTSPVPGVRVALQVQRPGSRSFVQISSDVTDQNGVVPFAFTSRTNLTLRAFIVQRTPLYSRPVATVAPASVNWAARPDLTVTHGLRAYYTFRVAPYTGASAHLEFRSASKRAWTKAKAVPVPNTGVVRLYVGFRTAGTWYVRGVGSTASNAPGYTSTLTVDVS
jgi:hypothetical protein